MTNKGNNYNQNFFERSQSARDIVREVMGSLSEEAVKGFTNIHNTAYRVDAPMVLREVAPTHNEQVSGQALSKAVQDAGRIAQELALPKDDHKSNYELIA